MARQTAMNCRRIRNANLTTDIFKSLVEITRGPIGDSMQSTDICDVFKLSKKLTKNYDASHDIGHHVKVFQNSAEILKKLDLGKLLRRAQYNRLILLITYSSLLHDVVDFKYPDSMEEKTKRLDAFLRKKCPVEAKNIKWIIDHVSYSKEKRFGYQYYRDLIVMLVRDIVSDADKLEALGEIGLDRCKKFTMATHPDAPPEEIKRLVVEHCHEKLLRLKDHYIRTHPGKEMAGPLHDVIARYVAN